MSADTKMPALTIESPSSSTPKRGPGRPKSTSKPTNTPTQDVRQALATLDSLYNLIATGLMITGLPASTERWIASAEDLRASNEDSLKAAPKLAHWIANAGSTGGAATFLITHGMAFATVLTVVRGELAERRASAPTGETTDEPRLPDTADFTRF